MLNVQQLRQLRFNPNEWVIVDERAQDPELVLSPGVDSLIFRKKGGKKGGTRYPPAGMTAAEILDVPNAKKYWRSIAQVRAYMEYVVQAKQEEEGITWHLYPDEELHPGLNGNRQCSQYGVRVLINMLLLTDHMVCLGMI